MAVVGEGIENGFISREVREVREVVAPKGATTKTVAVFCYGERFAMEKYNAEQCAM